MTDRQVRDRRVERTERLLHEAISTLVHEKPYDAIAVKEILARADVGRSTFYTHFRDKDELLVSGIRAMLRSGRPASRSPAGTWREDALWFSLPLFAHLDEHRRTCAGRMGVGGRAIVHGYLQRVIAEVVVDELMPGRGRGDSGRRLPPDLLARYVAATFVLVLEWWVESDSPLTAAEIDEHFRTLVRPVPAARTSAE